MRTACLCFFFFSSRRRHTRCGRDWSSDVCSSDLKLAKVGPLSDAAIESDLPLEQYKQTVLAQIGPELDSGRQIVVGQHNHFVRLQSVTDEFVIKDDPGGFTRGNMQATSEEARAMGLFWHWISIG